jgi:hypothetical protein
MGISNNLFLATETTEKYFFEQENYGTTKKI